MHILLRLNTSQYSTCINWKRYFVKLTSTIKIQFIVLLPRIRTFIYWNNLTTGHRLVMRRAFYFIFFRKNLIVSCLCQGVVRVPVAKMMLAVCKLVCALDSNKCLQLMHTSPRKLLSSLLHAFNYAAHFYVIDFY